MQQTVQHRDNTMCKLTLKDVKAYIALTDALKYNNNNNKTTNEWPVLDIILSTHSYTTDQSTDFTNY